MLEVVSYYFCYYMTHVLDCYAFSKMLKTKNKLNIKNLFLLLFLTFIDYAIGITYKGLIKILANNLFTFLILKILYKKKASKTLVGTLFTSIGYIFSELLYVIISIILSMTLNYNIDFDKGFGILISNGIIFIIYILIFSNNKVTNLINKIISWCDEINVLRQSTRFLLIIVFCYIFILPISYYQLGQEHLIEFIVVLVSILVFVIGYLNEKSNNNKLTIEYDQLLEYVKDYEVVITEKSKKQHEYKNQLIVIGDMVPKSNKKLKKYIEDKLDLENNYEENIWLEKMTNLPNGGIKGLVYFKVKKMLENNISVYIDIDKSLSVKKKWANVEKNLEDYTRILGVYLDNAIEACSKSKNKQIILEFKDNKDNIEFVLSNTYEGMLKPDSLENSGYTTKGKGRGYGLSLVKDIIDKNKYISQKKELNGRFYVQKLIIKK